tara:strand:- start:559 stop:846 length:288 start_codon:yes stop_codon:yes gene_type:complete
MKSLIIATAGILATFATLPASAGVLLPNLYAREYCTMRQSGVNEEGAVKWAVRRSYIDSGTAIKVTLEDGTQRDADVVAASNAAADLCPNYYYAD